MTEQELNELLYCLEENGYDAQDIHDAIESIEMNLNIDIKDLTQLDACAQICRYMDGVANEEDKEE